MFLRAALPRSGADPSVLSLNTLPTGAESSVQGLGPHPGWSHRAPSLPPLTVSCWLQSICIFKYVFNFLLLSLLPMSLPVSVAARGAVQPVEEPGTLSPPGQRGQGRGCSAGLRGCEEGSCPSRVPGLDVGNSPLRLFAPRVSAEFFVAVKTSPSPTSGIWADKGAHGSSRVSQPTRAALLDFLSVHLRVRI